MILESSIVIFQTLEPLPPQWPQQPWQPQWPQWPQQPHFINFLLILMVGSSLAPTLSIMVPFNRMDHQKFNFSLIFDTFSVGGCWGQPMLLFWKLVDETQISKPQNHTDTFIQNLTSIFLSVRPKLLVTFHYEIPCIHDLSKLSNIKVWEAAAVQIFFSLSGIQLSQNFLINFDRSPKYKFRLILFIFLRQCFSFYMCTLHIGKKPSVRKSYIS